ncbi:MAG: DUF2958 domain-containing protein [Pseudomonadota bacterium]
MWNLPTSEVLSDLPRLYQTEDIPLEDKMIHLHFFLGGCDWYIAEYDGKDTMFGFAILNGDTWNAEWGYVSLTELKEISISGIEVDQDIYWRPKKAKDIEKIRECNRF